MSTGVTATIGGTPRASLTAAAAGGRRVVPEVTDLMAPGARRVVPEVTDLMAPVLQTQVGQVGIDPRAVARWHQRCIGKPGRSPFGGTGAAIQATGLGSGDWAPPNRALWPASAQRWC